MEGFARWAGMGYNKFGGEVTTSGSIRNTENGQELVSLITRKEFKGDSFYLELGGVLYNQATTAFVQLGKRENLDRVVEASLRYTVYHLLATFTGMPDYEVPEYVGIARDLSGPPYLTLLEQSPKSVWIPEADLHEMRKIDGRATKAQRPTMAPPKSTNTKCPGTIDTSKPYFIAFKKGTTEITEEGRSSAELIACHVSSGAATVKRILGVRCPEPAHEPLMRERANIVAQLLNFHNGEAVLTATDEQLEALHSTCTDPDNCPQSIGAYVWFEPTDKTRS
jgi:hypothetical protein